jgi:hypothetical protein
MSSDNPVLALERNKSNTLHIILLVFGVLIIFQDIITQNLKSFQLGYDVFKYLDEYFPPLLFFFVAVMRVSNGRWIYRTHADIPLFAFIVIGIASSITKHVGFPIFGGQLLLDIKGFLLFYGIAQLDISIEILRSYIKVFFWIGILFLAAGIFDFIAPNQFMNATGDVIIVDYRNGLPTVKSLFHHPVTFGWFMNVLAIFCIAIFLNSKKGIYLLLGSIFIVGMLSAQRVKDIAGLISSIGIAIFFLPLKKRVSTVLILVFCIIVIFILFLPFIVNLFTVNINMYILGDNLSDIARDVLYVTSVRIANDNFPLGVGLGLFGSHLSYESYSPVYKQYDIWNVFGLSENAPQFISDTFWPMVIGETGWIGTILFLIVIFFLFAALVKHVKNSDQGPEKAFHLGTLMLFAEAFVESIASPIYVSPPMNCFLFGAVGLSYALYRTYQNKKE